MTKTEVFDYDVAEFLDSDEMISAYLTEALNGGDTDHFISAVNDVIRAKGMTKVANDAGLGRESLYKAFRPGAKPRFETVAKVLNALGIKQAIVAG